MPTPLRSHPDGPSWHQVVRALREAGGVTQEGWAAYLGVGRRTLQRWELGQLVPDARDEASLISLCREKGLFHRYEAGALAGVTASPEWLSALLAGARLAGDVPDDAAGAVSAAHFALPPGHQTLPMALTSLVGRDEDIDAVASRLAAARLVTLTGPGGSGKTRLALAAAEQVQDRYPDGLWFVDLSPIMAPSLVVSAIAQVFSVREGGEQSLTETLKTYMREKRLLLLLDNFEQVVEAAPVLPDLLVAAPGVTLLVTSRTLLRIDGEHEFAVQPLPVPDTAQVSDLVALAPVPAVALFVQRAQDARAGFTLTAENAAAVSAICTHLDGLPLALELGAARTRVLSPQALVARLEHRLTVLTGGRRDAPARQQTLRDTIAWSYDLLTPAEQALFRGLAVFAGGWTLESAEAICDPDGDLDVPVLDGLASLVEKNLVRRWEAPDSEPRFGMLETLREYALEQLGACGEAPVLRERHVRCFRTLVEEANALLYQGQWRRWRPQLRAEQENLRAALTWALSQGEAGFGLELLGALWFWYWQETSLEGHAWAERFLALPVSTTDHARALGLQVAGTTAWALGDLRAAHARSDESVPFLRASGDRRWLAQGLMMSGMFMAMGLPGDTDAAVARARSEEAVSIARGLDERYILGFALLMLGVTASFQGDPTAARAAEIEALPITRQVGDPWLMAGPPFNLGRIDFIEGQHPLARQRLENALSEYRMAGDVTMTAVNLNETGYLALQAGDLAHAAARFRECLNLAHREMGSRSYTAVSLGGLAGLMLRTNNPGDAARLLGAAHILQEQGGFITWPEFVASERAIVEETRAALGAEAFTAAYEEGRALSLDDAVALALEQTQPG